MSLSVGKFVCILAVAYVLFVGLASCRHYIFPMCPPKEWSIPGGKVKSAGTVNYKLECQYGYTTPLMYNDLEGHFCVDGKPDKLPRRCVRKFFALTTVQYGIVLKNKQGIRSACADGQLLRRIEGVRFQNIGLGKGHLYQVNSQLIPYKLRLSVDSCFANNGTYYLRIFVKNVPKANGTKEERKKFNNFIISKTFLFIKHGVFEKADYMLSEPEQDGLEQFLNFTIPNSQAGRRRRALSEQPVLAKRSPSAQLAKKGSEHGTYHLGHGHTSTVHATDASLTDSSHSALPSQHRLVDRDTHATADLPQEETRVKRAQGPLSPDDMEEYDGMIEANVNPVGYTCPSHLVMKELNNSEVLCIGCGRGWMLRREVGGPKCYPCGPGFYSETDTALTCKPCPVKYKTGLWDAASIDDCFKVEVTDEMKTDWILIGTLLPLGSTALLAVGLAILSKKMLGRSSYRTATQRKTMKAAKKAESEPTTLSPEPPESNES